MKVCKEFFSFTIEKGAMQEEMLGGFSLRTKNTYCTHSFPKVVSKFKWLKPKRSLVSNFISIGSWIEKTEQLFTFMNLSSSVLNLPKDSAFLIPLSKLFHFYLTCSIL